MKNIQSYKNIDQCIAEIVNQSFYEAWQISINLARHQSTAFANHIKILAAYNVYMLRKKFPLVDNVCLYHWYFAKNLINYSLKVSTKWKYSFEI